MPSEARYHHTIHDPSTSSSRKLQQLADLASKNGFKLNSREWGGSNANHSFTHLATGIDYLWAPSVLRARGFPKSATGERLTKLADLAAKNGFKLNSREWKGAAVKHSFTNIDTQLDYFWTPAQLASQGFPKNEKSPELMLARLAAIASRNGYKLNAVEWEGSNVKHRFTHIATQVEYLWKPNQILIKGFPKDRDIYKLKRSASDSDRFSALEKAAKANGFLLRSCEWLGSRKKHEFLHEASGELYFLEPNAVMGRAGFPLTLGQRYVTEEVCRQAMCHIFGGRFESNRARLHAVNGGAMELDGFERFDSPPAILEGFSLRNHGNKITEVAFEFQGHQSHYEDEGIMRRDRQRAKYCKDQGILLVVIDRPHDWNRNRDAAYMFQHVCSSIQKLMPTNSTLKYPIGFKVDLSSWQPDLKLYNDLCEFALASKFRVVSPIEWKGATTKYTFQHIETGDLYESVPGNVRTNGFPKNTARSKRSNQERLAEIKQLATKSNYILLDDEWRGARELHRFQHIPTSELYWGSPQNLLIQGFPLNRTRSQNNRVRLPKSSASSSKQERLTSLAQCARANGYILVTDAWLGTREIHEFMNRETGEIYRGRPQSIMGSQGFPKKKVNKEKSDPQLSHAIEDESPAVIFAECDLLSF